MFINRNAFFANTSGVRNVPMDYQMNQQGNPVDLGPRRLIFAIVYTFKGVFCIVFFSQWRCMTVGEGRIARIVRKGLHHELKLMLNDM